MLCESPGLFKTESMAVVHGQCREASTSSFPVHEAEVSLKCSQHFVCTHGRPRVHVCSTVKMKECLLCALARRPELPIPQVIRVSLLYFGMVGTAVMGTMDSPKPWTTKPFQTELAGTPPLTYCSLKPDTGSVPSWQGAWRR